jgi:hypothetical protein
MKLKFKSRNGGRCRDDDRRNLRARKQQQVRWTMINLQDSLTKKRHVMSMKVTLLLSAVNDKRHSVKLIFFGFLGL